MKQLAGIVAATAALGVAWYCVISVAGAQGLATSPGPAYPVKPIRLAVSVAPGGNLDLIGRAVAQKLTESLSRPIIVENRPRANATIGTENVARSAPDGYTVLMVAPVGTPKEVVARIHAEIVKFTQQPDVRNRFAQQGVELQSSHAPEQFSGYIKSQFTRWAKVIHEAGITAE